MSRILCYIHGNPKPYWVERTTGYVWDAQFGGDRWKSAASYQGGGMWGYPTGAILVEAPGGQQTAAAHVPPPIGLRPDYIAVLAYDKNRAVEIAEAVQRYAAALHPIPPDWLAELNELIERNQPTPETETIQ